MAGADTDDHVESLVGIAVVASGDGVVVLAKPAGTAAEMRADPGAVSILGKVNEVWPEARLPHRLDRVTSGLQVVCRDAESVASQNEDIAAGRWDKTYVVRIPRQRDMRPLLGRHQRYLSRDGRQATVVRSGGKPAALSIEAVAPDPEHRDAMQALVRLHTGRYHQIRVMLADLGCPLIGDDRYGGRREPQGPWLEHTRLAGVDLGSGGIIVVLPSDRRAFAYAAEIDTAVLVL